ncbi:uncharacterized protein B0H18DRAFT_592272 [Fomitopsis serialis]|uniref:uncharacterized protein n=1 Tax=Fomitopsis serialis TaxID=139415 RepID=UPI00200888DD|nr:uncharacterized protein B0H18DRAFT_592272 [Neoantrodia serialis]KAH9920433.1 hypothetical protein B0H18DRAFT_592272 [Neoantrodia serialis]
MLSVVAWMPATIHVLGVPPSSVAESVSMLDVLTSSLRAALEGHETDARTKADDVLKEGQGRSTVGVQLCQSPTFTSWRTRCRKLRASSAPHESVAGAASGSQSILHMDPFVCPLDRWK